MPKIGTLFIIFVEDKPLHHMIIIQSRRKKRENILKDYPNATIIDVTSKSEDDYIRMSPFYPHWGIPVPFSPNWSSVCVEAVWQGLKVFEKAGIDTKLFSNSTMKNLKRTEKKYGKTLGHLKGVNGKTNQLLNYLQARLYIYAPTYRWVLENRVQDLVERIRELASHGTVVLLDYETNTNIYVDKPISHAGLVKAYIEGNYPEAKPLVDNVVPDDVLDRFFLGQKVVHFKYGFGVLSSIQGRNATVDFKSGSKVLDLGAGVLKPYNPVDPAIKPKAFSVQSHRDSVILLESADGLWGVQAKPDRKVEAIPCEYEEIKFYAGKLAGKQKVPTYYFIVKKNGCWGLLNKLGRQQAPCIYEELYPRESPDGLLEGFSFKRDGLKGVIDGKGNETIE